ncbi:MAG: hypothetical protein M3441_03935 [Chloroflexota bacterium]|nr:hypothetical protein [Chloroflexota bacterium]
MATTLERNLAEHPLSDAVQQGLPLVSSVLGALLYADLFDAPLSLAEIHRYQIATSYAASDIAEALRSQPGLIGLVSSEGDNYCLKGREELFLVRKERAESSARVWKRARLYTRWLRRLPFVRMVAVTGALAVDNLSGRHDIDLLVIARPGRVWLCRRGLIAWVRIGRLLGDDLCPNYILSQGSLELSQRDFFTAHELAQMVPLFGDGVYEQMLAANEWARAFLPSLSAPTRLPAEATSHARRTGPVEKVLRRSAFDRWERWELDRLRKKLRSDLGRDAEVVLTADQCKGHTGLHRAAVMTRYLSRLHEMGLHDVAAVLEAAGSSSI